MSSHVVSPLLYRTELLGHFKLNRNLSAQGLAVLRITVLLGVPLPIDACASQGLYLTQQNAKVLFLRRNSSTASLRWKQKADIQPDRMRAAIVRSGS